MDFFKNMFNKKDRPSTIPTTADITKNSITLHGEDPGTIPPDDTPNPLTNETKE